MQHGEHEHLWVQQQAASPRTWLWVGVVHSVSVELQQLLRFSFFLPVAAHSKRVLTNLEKITKLRWHRVITRRSKALTNAACWQRVYRDPAGAGAILTVIAHTRETKLFTRLLQSSLTTPCCSSHLILCISTDSGLISSIRGSSTL